jgi:hypothetical protein
MISHMKHNLLRVKQELDTIDNKEYENKTKN